MKRTLVELGAWHRLREPTVRYETARVVSAQYRARTAFLSGLPTGVSGSVST
jgi:hypothetical protein